MSCISDWFYQVAVCGIRKIVHNLQGSIVCTFELDLVDLEFHVWTCKVEFLIYFYVLTCTNCLLMLMSRSVKQNWFEMLFPRCLKLLTHGKVFPHNSISFHCFGFFMKEIHFVLHFIGFTPVLNFRLCLAAKFSKQFNNVWSAYSVAAKSIFSSEYPNIPW